jgi:hypothetical protein
MIWQAAGGLLVPSKVKQKRKIKYLACTGENKKYATNVHIDLVYTLFVHSPQKTNSTEFFG